MFRRVAPFLLLALAACHRSQEPVLNGRVEAYLTDLGPRAAGRLVELKVVEGQRVKAGDLLARVHAEELDAAVDRDLAALQAAEAKSLEAANGTRLEDIAQGEAKVKDADAALRLAEENLKRASRLFKDGVLSQAELDRAQTERDRAQAGLNLASKALAELRAGLRQEQRSGVNADARRAKAVLELSRAQAKFTEIRAPFDGVVVHRLREPGSVLGVGQGVVTLARLDTLWVRVYLPQTLQAKARIGLPVEVATADRRTFQATLDEVSSEPEFTPKMVETREERVNLVYPARVHLKEGFDKGLVPGLSVDVRLKVAP
ncbi:MAG: HlyD family efflux transporter periplasmic adaptor subunit [Holophagaceae bacterium]